MESKTNVNAHAQFAAIFAPVLNEQLRKAGAAAGELAPEAPPAEAAALLESAAFALPLRFEGALAGECFLVMSSESASLLAGAENDAKQLLTGALQAASEPLAAALFAHFGTVRIVLGEDRPKPEGAEAVAWLAGTNESGAAVTLGLFADGELQRGLGRLARVRAAAEASGITGGNLGLVMDVELNVALRFGQRQLSLREVMDLSSGSVVELDREVDEPVELILDGRVIARGEAVIVDGNYGVRVTEVLHPVVF